MGGWVVPKEEHLGLSPDLHICAHTQWIINRIYVCMLATLVGNAIIVKEFNGLKKKDCSISIDYRF